MTSPNDEAPLCSDCEERLATTEYTLDGDTIRVCETCLDREVAQDAFNNALIRVIGLKRSGHHDEALACLTSVLDANRSRDHDKAIARNVASQRAWVLDDAGRFAEAEQAYKEWAEIGFRDVWNQQLYALGLADTLEKLGRDREAIPILEDALGKERPWDLQLAMSVLTTLVGVSGKVGRPVDAKWLRVAEAIAKHFGVEMPSAPSVEAAILALSKMIEGRPEPLLERGEGELSSDQES